MDQFKKFLVKLGFKSADGGSYSSLTDGGRGTPLSGNASDSQLLASNKNWVFTCVDRIATTISGIEIELRQYDKKNNEVVVQEHKILDLLERPNSYQTGRDFWYMVISHILLTGNAYILKNAPQNPTELAVLIPSGVRVQLNKERTAIEGYKYQMGSYSKTFTVDEIVHIKKSSVTNPFKGTGVLSQIAAWVDVDEAATEFNRLFFVNGAALSGILKTEATTEDGLLLAKRGFEQRYTGANNAHKTAVLPKGASYEDKTATPHDMQFSEMDTRYRDKILAGFGVPKSVVGIVEDVNRASAEAAMYSFMVTTIDPIMKWLVAYLNTWLLPDFSGTEKMYFTYQNIIPENADLLIRQNQAALAGQSYMSINEVRALQGLPPISGGDYVYGGFANIPIGKPEVPQTANTLADADIKQVRIKHLRIKEAMKREKTVEDLATSIETKADLDGVVKALRAEMAAVAHKEFIARVSTYEGKFEKAVKSFDKTVEAQVLENLKEGEKAIRVKTKDLIDKPQVTALFIGLTSPILQDLLKTEGQAQMDRLDTTVPFDPFEDNAQKRLKRMLELTAQSYTDTTLRILSNSLEEGINNGESLPSLTQRVADVFALTDQYRAQQVARTTVFGVANSAARDAYKQSGVVRTVAWHTAEDELVCEFCGPMDGKTIGVDDSFFDKGDTVHGEEGGNFPVSFMGIEDPPLHPNCRCFTNAEDIEVSRD